jgi:GGDEF domain-containing protein
VRAIYLDPSILVCGFDVSLRTSDEWRHVASQLDGWTAVCHEEVVVHSSARIGVAGCDEVTDETVAGLVCAADAALYRAKREGGEGVALASEGAGLNGAHDHRAQLGVSDRAGGIGVSRSPLAE